MSIRVEISPGELIDRITILEIKSERIADADKRRHVIDELALSVATRDRALAADPRRTRVTRFAGALKAINGELWDVEDALRDCERAGDFGEAFVALARSVYRLNDRRAAVKRAINVLLESALVEEKSYQPY